MKRSSRSLVRRVVASVLAICIAALGCEWTRPLTPVAGVIAFQEPGYVIVPGGRINGAGGNLIVERTVSSIDTLLGRQWVRAVYNSATGHWRWSFQTSYDGVRFVDASGREHRIASLAAGPIPGSQWSRVDGDTIESRGGLRFHFDASGRLDHVAWRFAAYPRIQYAWSATEVAVSQCAGVGLCTPVYSIGLDTAGRPVSIVDARTSRTALAAYAADGQLDTLRTGGDVEAGRTGTRFEYETFGTLLTSIVNSESERIEYRYQAGRRILKVVQSGESDPTHRFEFGTNGPVESPHTCLYTNPIGGATRLYFDAARRLLRVERVLTGEFTQTAWEGLRPVQHRSFDGTWTGFTWEGDDLVERVDASGNVVTFEYEPGASRFDDPWSPPLRRVSDSLGLVEERTYDGLGRPVTFANGAGETVAVVYGAATVDSVAQPGGVTRSFPVYGIHGHWLRAEVGESSDHRDFDPVGNPRVAGLYRREGGVLAQDYDADRQLASLTLAETLEGEVVASATLAIERRSDGGLLRVARPGGADHEFDYDALGRVVARRERVDGQWQTTTFAYDPMGHVVARELPNGMRDERTYDAYGRLTSRRALRDGVLWGQITFEIVDGRRVSADDSRLPAVEMYTYDTAGRLQSTTFASGEVLSTQYDVRSRVVAETFSLPQAGSGRTLTYAYDLADRRLSVHSDVEGLLAEHEFEQGRHVRTLHGNGLERTFGYGSDGELVSTMTVDAAGVAVEQTTVERFPASAPARLALEATTQTPLGTTEETFWLGLPGGLSNPDRAVGKRVFGWSTAGSGVETWAYDPLSNRGDGSGGDFSEYNVEGNRLQTSHHAATATTLDYAYDAAGFVTSRTGVALAWTATGRLAGFAEHTLEWDLQDRLVRHSATSGATVETRFGGRGLVDAATALHRLELGFVSLELDGSAQRYRHLDFRGNVSFVSDESGAVVEHHRYGAYGGVESLGAQPTLGFVARTSVGELMRLGARMYDPAVGRFLSPDPIFQLVNQYTYTLGNPIWFADPGGEEVDSLTAGANAVADGVGLGLTIAGAIVAGPPATAAAAVVTAAAIGFSGFFFAYSLAIWLSSASF